MRAARVARLATHNPSGAIDIVPITFAFVDDDTIVTAVDHKPKRTPRLQRLENIRADPDVTLLVDEYDDDWTKLWWVRIRGRAAVIASPPRDLLEPLIRKYEQYRSSPPTDAIIVVAVSSVRHWSATGDYGRA